MKIVYPADAALFSAWLASELQRRIGPILAAHAAGLAVDSPAACCAYYRQAHAELLRLLADVAVAVDRLAASADASAPRARE